MRARVGAQRVGVAREDVEDVRFVGWGVDLQGRVEEEVGEVRVGARARWRRRIVAIVGQLLAPKLTALADFWTEKKKPPKLGLADYFWVAEKPPKVGLADYS